MVERCGALVISSICGKGVVPEGHSQVLGAALSMPEARALLAKADLVLGIVTELSTVDASNQTLSFGGSLIRVDLDPRKKTDRYPVNLPILADTKLTAEALVAALPVAGGGLATAWQEDLPRVRQQFQVFGGAKTAEHRRVLAALRDALPAEAIVVGDMTQLAYSGNHAFPVDRSRPWLHPASFANLEHIHFMKCHSCWCEIVCALVRLEQTDDVAHGIPEGADGSFGLCADR